MDRYSNRAASHVSTLLHPSSPSEDHETQDLQQEQRENPSSSNIQRRLKPQKTSKARRPAAPERNTSTLLHPSNPTSTHTPTLVTTLSSGTDNGDEIENDDENDPANPDLQPADTLTSPTVLLRKKSTLLHPSPPSSPPLSPPLPRRLTDGPPEHTTRPRRPRLQHAQSAPAPRSAKARKVSVLHSCHSGSEAEGDSEAESDGEKREALGVSCPPVIGPELDVYSVAFGRAEGGGRNGDGGGVV